MKDLPFFIIIGIEKCPFLSTKTTCDVTWQLKDIYKIFFPRSHYMSKTKMSDLHSSWYNIDIPPFP